MASHFILPAVLLLITLAFGLWVSLAGKPYKTLLFNIHKLAALAAVVLFVIRMIPLLKSSSPPALLLSLAVFSGLCVIVLFATGAIMSIGTQRYRFILSLHRVTLFLLLGAAVSLVWLILRTAGT